MYTKLGDAPSPITSTIWTNWHNLHIYLEKFLCQNSSRSQQRKLIHLNQEALWKLLLEEILHHLRCINPNKNWDSYHINWFAGFLNHQQNGIPRVSLGSINSSLKLRWNQTYGRNQPRISGRSFCLFKKHKGMRNERKHVRQYPSMRC